MLAKHLNIPGIFLLIQPVTSCQTGLIDMEKLEENALLFRPKMLIVGASAYCREWDYPAFRAVADKCGALMMVDMAHIRCVPCEPACVCVWWVA